MSVKRAVHICSFTSVPPVGQKTRYKDLKAAVLEAGRYSVFEATANGYAAAMFARLDRDAELVIDRRGFLWTGVRLKPSCV